MAVNLDALSVVHPALGASLETRLPHTAHIYRTLTTTATPTDQLMGYGTTPTSTASVGNEVVGPFPCEFGPYKTRDGKQITAGDGKVVTQPIEIIFRAADGALVKARDQVEIGDRKFSVIVPPTLGTFDVLVGAIAQEVR